MKISVLQVTGDLSGHRQIHQFLLKGQTLPVKQLFFLILKSNNKLSGCMETNHFVEVTEWNMLCMQPSFQNSAMNDFFPFPFLPSSFHHLHTVPTVSPKMLAYEVVLVNTV